MPKPKDIARWLREQHDKALDLSAQLSETIAAIPRNRVEEWLADLAGEFERYRAHFEKHMALEEEGGYLVPVVEQRPTIAAEVDQLHAQHAEISQLMTWIFTEVRSLTPQRLLLVRDACARIQTLIAIIKDHEEHENLLVSHVFTQEMGTKD